MARRRPPKWAANVYARLDFDYTTTLLGLTLDISQLLGERFGPKDVQWNGAFQLLWPLAELDWDSKVPSQKATTAAQGHTDFWKATDLWPGLHNSLPKEIWGCTVPSLWARAHAQPQPGYAPGAKCLPHCSSSGVRDT